MGWVGFEPSVRILSFGFMLISYRDYELTFSDFRVIERLEMYFIIYSHSPSQLSPISVSSVSTSSVVGR